MLKDGAGCSLFEICKMKYTVKSNSITFILAIALVVFSCSDNHLAKDDSERAMIKNYYAAYEKKDWGLMTPILASEFTFTSPAGDDHIHLDLYKKRCWPNAYKTKRFDLQEMLIDGDNAYVTYNGWTTDDKLFRNTERFKFKDGKIIENECFFGTGISFPNNSKSAVKDGGTGK